MGKDTEQTITASRSPTRLPSTLCYVGVLNCGAMNEVIVEKHNKKRNAIISVVIPIIRLM